MKVLVTGAAGFIGSHACERLSSLGHDVVGIDNFSDYYSMHLKRLNAKALTSVGVQVLRHDLRSDDLADVLPNNFDYIFHFAAHPGISSSSTFEDYFSNNILATQNLVDYAVQLPSLKMLVNIGTSSVYGLEATFPETTAPQPASHYGVTKLTAEQLVLQKSREKAFPSCSLRLYSVIGPRERPEKMYTRLISSAFNNTEFPLFEGSASHLRSFTYVGDIIDGVVSIIGKESILNGEIINLGTEVEHSTLEGIKAVESVIGKSINIKHVPARVGDQLRTRANIGKARSLLGYNPQTTLIEGVRAQVAWYKEYFYKPATVGNT